MVKKLREAAQELEKYEQSAVPKGWSCHWDRYCISLNTTSMSRTTSLPYEIFQVKEKLPFWIADPRYWEVFQFLTFQLFVNFVFKLVYEVFFNELCPRSCEEIEIFCDKTIKGIIFHIRHVVPCVANNPVVAFAEQKTLDVCSSMALYGLGVEKYILIKSTRSRKVLRSFMYSPCVFKILFPIANYANLQLREFKLYPQEITRRRIRLICVNLRYTPLI